MISDELREQLDDVQISKLAEYLCERLDLDVDATMLQLEFLNGRYQKMKRFVKPHGDLTRAAVRSSSVTRSGRSGA